MDGNESNNDRVKIAKSPWFQNMYSNALKFYKKDEELDANDRFELYQIYSSIRNSELIGGWLGFGSFFSLPYLVKYYKVGNFKGVRVPTSIVIGFTGMILSSHLAAESSYNKAIKKLDPDEMFKNRNKYDYDGSNPDGGAIFEDQKQMKSSKQRQYEMLTLLQIGSPTMWSNYFYMTYKNPNKRFPDPSKKMEEFKQGKNNKSSFLNRRDPFQLYSGPDKEKAEGVIKNTSKSAENENPFNEVSYQKVTLDTTDYGQQNTRSSTNGSSWDKVRREANNDKFADPNDSSDSIFGFDDQTLPIEKNGEQ
ncbi:hypothetical protein TPHA_0J01090 [Tetrapisispora phaffii CBS 4417]|uniref:Uncharacterized protein n=1 Tax=Tetrapisispora phaffii (strain ATCC 24235 / CBS 4417 / NBRC 1672 / NRRL Y-8282 / UCD 70-5) TaxID=1071381 RepID=G8BYI9_TETPH|nr:hypothetical protein TPHA_0J01090 [Tetrapisispora phaffii CBS 4417]CCE64931.1 hypothetical protein TPHA_0J01090 [Tetrapisispora phaffii CBS 4417]